ncbi:MAG: hypothetical protein IPF74_12215 [Rhodocyclaceae bacterium]|nr:hypothetical protein [Rhodocyclaceae bacterium]MBK6677866.1 hypothetical protein [Rhodocyclaceae bacterium]
MDAGLAARIERFKKALAAFEAASDEEMAVEIAARVSQFAAPLCHRLMDRLERDD